MVPLRVGFFLYFDKRKTRCRSCIRKIFVDFADSGVLKKIGRSEKSPAVDSAKNAVPRGKMPRSFLLRLVGREF